MRFEGPPRKNDSFPKERSLQSTKELFRNNATREINGKLLLYPLCAVLWNVVIQVNTQGEVYIT